MGGIPGKITLITGAAGALGMVVTRSFLRAEAQVVAAYRTDQTQDALVSLDHPDAPELMAVKADVTKEKDVDRLFQSAYDRFGRIDALVNLAGGYIGDIPLAQLEEQTWDHMMAINLKSCFLCCRAALRHMLDQGSGVIINTASRGAVEPYSGAAAYSVSKAGVIALTKAIAEEVRGKQINVNVILPGTIDTEVNRQAMPKADFDAWVSPQAIADLILFLASDEARHIHGAAIPIFGRP
ncbi:MAG: SDR family oxidoreductase [Acidobacteria bacterium]|nr:SDR family oxidoreductase [Acidobacteriota bacterium]